jgi:hypothetical protein
LLSVGTDVSVEYLPELVEAIESKAREVIRHYRSQIFKHRDGTRSGGLPNADAPNLTDESKRSYAECP